MTMTYRERRLAKTERLRGWAEKRKQAAAAQLTSNPGLREDHAFNTQPGHIPERARMIAADDRAFHSLQKAESMSARASAIEAQTDHAIYSDDPDAPERLKQKIADLEQTRDHDKAINAAIRSMKRTSPRLDEAGILAALVAGDIMTQAEAASLARSYALQPYHGLGYPAYHITNLGANIRRQKERLAEIEREKVDGPPWRYYAAARYEGTCPVCQLPILKGSAIMYRRGTDETQHSACYEKANAGTGI